MLAGSTYSDIVFLSVHQVLRTLAQLVLLGPDGRWLILGSLYLPTLQQFRQLVRILEQFEYKA